MTRTLDVRLDKSVPERLSREMLSKVRYISEGITAATFVDDDRSMVRIDFDADIEARKADIATSVNEIARKVSSNHRLAAPPTVLAQGQRRHASAQAGIDPHESLIAGQELFRYGSGRYGYGPLLVDMMQRLHRLCDRYGKSINARAQQFPSLIGADTLTTCNYVKSFPHSLNLVLHLKEDLSAIHRFAQSATLDGHRLEVDRASLASPETLLSPSVCFHCYAWLAHAQHVHDRSFLAVGKCFRYESGNMAGLERLWDFTMHETIFVGTKDYVLGRRQACVEFAQSVADSLDLDYRIESATDPFFIEDFATQAAFQSAFDLKFEILADLPYRGTPLAVGSINYHQNFFGRAFQISDNDGAPVHTVCLGFGLERLALAVLAQHGVDAAHWPDALRSA